MVDFLFVIIELSFAIPYSWDVISGNLSKKSAFFERKSHFEHKFHTEWAVAYQPLGGVRKLE